MTNEEMLEEIEVSTSKLSVYEEEFIGNVGDRIRAGIPLSDAQQAILEQIYKKVTR